VEAGANQEKLSAIADYEASAAFTPGEKALLALAFAAGQSPNEANSAHFTALKDHFSEEQIVQAVGVVSLFGFLNRWNDTMATTLEKAPMAFAKASLDAFSWAAGKHGPSEPGA
jgi:alkylhydroperoxidase family enzyme